MSTERASQHIADNSAKAKKMIVDSIDQWRLPDRGRSRSYDAEARAFGGFWYEDSCIGPKFSSWSELEEMFEMAVDWASENILPTMGRLPVRPTLHRTGKNHDYCSGDFRSGAPRISMSWTQKHSMRVHCLLHEVAHWCVVGGVPHGDAWKRAYVALVYEFMGTEYGNRLSTAFGFSDISNVVPTEKRRTRATYIWEVLSVSDGVETWTPVKRKDLDMTHNDDLRAKHGYQVLAYLKTPNGSGHAWKSKTVRATKR